MRPDEFDFLGNFSTIWAIIVGAVLATIGGFVATQMEWILEQRRRERNAALLFGEVLSTLGVLMSGAERARGIGDPYGRVTMRMLRSAKAEIDIYDRNRESLYDLRDADLRARIHMLVLRIAMPVDGIFDASREIDAAQLTLKTPGLTDVERKEIEALLVSLEDSRTGGFDFAMENVRKMQATIHDLEPVAGHAFESMEAVSRREI